MDQILRHTPLWVWGVLLLLLVLGWRARQDRELSLNQTLILPLVILVLTTKSLLGHFSQPTVWLVWGVGLALALLGMALLGVSERMRFNPQQKTLYIAGSWLPMALMLGVFISKYCFEVALAVNPQWATQMSFAFLIALTYGVFNGLMFRNLLQVFLQRRSAQLAVQSC
ncbi:DUF6622 family protein [Deefgea rivuli]|uniref:DUF6622 family protein n=1 Tax=Deefgea rivuli TaxID=400948 RepID=UPI00055A816C|nr:DUF6622 family protein [Deefgea rivuli]